MKLNELITEFDIYMTNEERAMYEQLNGIVDISSLNERETIIVNSLVRKSLVSKIRYNNSVVVARNEL